MLPIDFIKIQPPRSSEGQAVSGTASKDAASTPKAFEKEFQATSERRTGSSREDEAESKRESGSVEMSARELGEEQGKNSDGVEIRASASDAPLAGPPAGFSASFEVGALVGASEATENVEAKNVSPDGVERKPLADQENLAGGPIDGMPAARSDDRSVPLPLLAERSADPEVKMGQVEPEQPQLKSKETPHPEIASNSKDLSIVPAEPVQQDVATALRSEREARTVEVGLTQKGVEGAPRAAEPVNVAVPINVTTSAVRNDALREIATEPAAGDDSSRSVEAERVLAAQNTARSEHYYVSNVAAALTTATPDASRLGASLDSASPSIDSLMTGEQRSNVERITQLTPVTQTLAATQSASLDRPVVDQIIARLNQIDNGRFEIRLRPAELGTIVLQVSDASAAQSVVVSADKSDIFELLRRNEALLANEFKEAGFGDLSFSFTMNEQDREEAQAADGAASEYELAELQASPEGIAQALGRATGQMDIRL